MADHAPGGGQAPAGSGQGQELNFRADAFSPEQLESGRKLFAASCDFFHAAQALDHLPEPRGVEIALAGRSNALARVSHQPGRTRQLNFFQLEAAPIVLVDMPGYGYAEAPLAIKRDWQGLMLDYLRGRPNLRRVLLLLDSRVEIKTSDLTVLELLDQSAVSYQIVLTKADAVKKTALTRKQEEVRALAASHPAALNEVITTSSETGFGIDELRASIATFS
jgi:GTP-binding protein